jgi:hypothetical protein
MQIQHLAFKYAKQKKKGIKKNQPFKLASRSKDRPTREISSTISPIFNPRFPTSRVTSLPPLKPTVMTGGCVEFRGNCVTLMSMCVGLLVGTVVGVRSSVRKSRQGREAAEKGLKVVRKEVIVLIGIGILVVGLVGLGWRLSVGGSV